MNKQTHYRISKKYSVKYGSFLDIVTNLILPLLIGFLIIAFTALIK